MKSNVKFVGLILFMLLALTILFPATAYSAEGETREVRGYADMGVEHPDLTVSNVTKIVDEKSVDERLDAYFVTGVPAVITTLNDAAMFYVYPLEKQDDTFAMVGDPLPVSGKAKIWVPAPIDPPGDVLEIIDVSELENYDVDMPSLLKGCNVTLTEPGYYYVLFCYEALAGSTELVIEVKGEGTEAPTTESNSDSNTNSTTTANATAKPATSKVYVNGTSISFDAYNINGNNYFKLRDMAKTVNGTEKQFEVVWDTKRKAINLISNKPYTAVGGEMAKGDGKAKNATINTSKIYQDGAEVSLTAYQINGNNYFKLRDLASAFNIGLSWDGKANAVKIETAKSYVAE